VEAREAKCRPKPQGPIPPDGERWHGVGEQATCLAVEHRLIAYLYPLRWTLPIPEGICYSGHTHIGAKQPDVTTSRRQCPGAGTGLHPTRLQVAPAEGVGRVEHIHRLAEAALIDDDISRRLGRKDNGVETPELIHREIFYPSSWLGQELADTRRRPRPGWYAIQGAAAIAARPHGAIGRHGHRKEAGRARPRDACHHALA
jgi:hypothetical protein